MPLIHIIKIRFGMHNFALPNDGGDGPGFATRQWNPREATMATMHGLVRDNTDWAIIFGVQLSWIKNLQEIKDYDPKSGQPIPRIIWTKEAKVELAATLKQLRAVQKRIEEYTKRDKVPVTKAMEDMHKEDDALLLKVTKVLEVQGQFVVRLVDLGE